MDPLSHTHLPSPVYQALKGVRDVAADTLAAAASRSAAVERAMAAAGRALNRRSFAYALFQRRAVESLAARRAAREPVLRRMRVGGFDVWGEPDHFTFARPYFFGQPYEPRTTELIAALPERGVFVDVGANHGYFSLLAALRVGPRGRVAAFEPNPAAAARLLAVLRANGVAKRVTVSPAALTDGWERNVTLFLSPVAELDGLASLQPAWDAASDAPRVEVPAVSFDEWSSYSRFPQADLVKIDVEGGEEAVLRGMTRTLSWWPPRAIVCETAAGGPADRLLREAGYAVRALDVGDGVFGNWLYTHGG